MEDLCEGRGSVFKNTPAAKAVVHPEEHKTRLVAVVVDLVLATPGQHDALYHSQKYK